MLAILIASAMQSSTAHARSGLERLDRVEQRVLRLVNRERARHGLARLRSSRRLRHAADFHSWEMMRVDFFAHASANGQSSSDRIRRFRRARYTGENIAWVGHGGGSQSTRVVRMWLNSPGHRAVLLHPKFRRVGIARRTGDLGGGRATVYTADFQSTG